MSTAGLRKELPAWVMPCALAAGVLLIGFLAYCVMTGTSGNAAGPAREVRPGMYDFRKEAQQGSLGRRTDSEGGNTP